MASRKSYSGPVLNGVHVGKYVSSSIDTIKMTKDEPYVTEPVYGPETENLTMLYWLYRYREFWFRNKKYGAWVTAGTTDSAFNTLSAGYAMENYT